MRLTLSRLLRHIARPQHTHSQTRHKIPNGRRLFFAHIPKCAGTSLLSSISQHVPLTRIYKNTSIFENFRYGREEFYNLTETAKGELLVLWGHHLHEQMLLPFGNDCATMLCTVLREPIDRFVSHVAYDFTVCKDRGVEYDMSAAIESVDNPVCKYLLERFPSFDNHTGSLAQRAFGILEWFDNVFLMSEMHEAEIVLSDFLALPIQVPRENVGSSRVAILAAIDMQALKSRLAEDIELYRLTALNSAALRRTDANEISLRTSQRCHRLAKNDVALRDFLTKKVAIEYHDWKVLEIAIEQKIKLIGSLKDEVERLDQFRRVGKSLET